MLASWYSALVDVSWLGPKLIKAVFELNPCVNSPEVLFDYNLILKSLAANYESVGVMYIVGAL